MNKRNIHILYAIALLQGMVFYAPVATLYRQAAGLGIFQITLIESISLALTLAMELPWGVIADKIGYKKTMIACCGLYFVSKIVFWRAEGFGGFLIERIMLAVVCAGLSGVDETLLYLSAGKKDSQKCFGVYDGMTQTGLLLSALIYSLFVGENYRLAGLLTVFSYGAAAVLSFGVTDVQDAAVSKPKTAFSASFRQIFRNKKLLMLIFAAALIAETHQTITVFLVQRKYALLDMSSLWIGAAFILLSLSGILGGRVSAVFTAKLGRGNAGRILMLLSAAACVLLAFAAHPFAAVCAAILLRVSFSVFAPLSAQLQNEQVETSNRATELSVNALIMSSVGVVTNLVFGRIAEANLTAALLTGTAMCMAAYVLYNLFLRRKDA